MHANGGLGEAEDQRRRALFAALREGDGAQALEIASQIAQLEALKPMFDSHWWAWLGEWKLDELARQVPQVQLPAPTEAELADELQELESRLRYL
jgi:hypothetical protein